MRHKLLALMALVSVLFALMMPTLAWAEPGAMPRAQEEPNLLQNSDFEGGGDTWPLQDGIGEVQVASGWRGYYLDLPPAYVKRPDFCYDQVTGKKKDNGCFWARPEFRDVTKKTDPHRIHGGQRAQKYFTYGRMHEAGLMQRVTGVISGTQYHFSIYMQAWMCNNFVEQCKGGLVSDAPTTMHLKVGIDPTGGTNPFSPNIVWSGEVDSFDRWTQYSVDAAAKGDTITVFTHSRPEWTDFARLNNDVYTDDASLTAVGVPQPETQPASSKEVKSTSTPTQQPSSFAVKPQQGRRSDGTVIHVVQPNDTLFGIALAYGVTVDDIVQLNNIKPGDFLQIGQELIVKGLANPPSATALPASRPSATPAAAAALPQPTLIAGELAPGGLCVQAFDDRNGNGVYDQNEELVANVKFSVLAGTDQVVSYTTSATDEPHCFTGLAPRAYTVRAEAPKGYVATTDAQIGVALASGQTVNYSFGILPSGSKGVKAASSGSESSGWLGRDSGTFLGIGVGVLFAVGMIGFLFLSRRK